MWAHEDDELVEEEEIEEETSDDVSVHEDTTEDTLKLLVALIGSLSTSRSPDDAERGCVHPGTAESLQAKISSAWSGGRQEKLSSILTACIALVQSLCNRLTIDFRDPPRG